MAHLSVRVDDEKVDALDELVTELCAVLPTGAPQYTRSDVARLALERGVEALQREHKLRTAKRVR